MRANLAGPAAATTEGSTTMSDDALPPPNSADSQAEQAAALTEPSFEYRARDEAAILAREFGPPDSSGVYGRNQDAALDQPTRRADVEGRSS
jgi:hypothetical protein